MPNTHLMSPWETKAKQVCADAGVKITKKRLEVFVTLLKAKQPLSAYELIAALKDDFGRQLTPISTYRMLEFLEEQHLVRKLKSTGKYLAFDIRPTSNSQAVSQFLICRECGTVKEVEVESHFLKALKAHMDASGFRVNNLELEWDCVCSLCSGKLEKKCINPLNRNPFGNHS